MAYNAWSVAAFEQPTAAKWNQLGENDAGFRDGSNIDDSAIQLRHIDWQDNLLSEGHLIGGYIQTAVSSNDLIISIKTESGANPSAAEPVYIVIQGTLRTIASALSLTLADATNWFGSGASILAAQEIDYFVYLGWRAASSQVFLGLARFGHGRFYSDFNATNTNAKYLAYSSSALASTDAVTVIGRINATLSAGAGYTWTIPATSIIIQRPIFETRELSMATPTYTGSGLLTYTTVTTRYAKYQVRYGRVFFRLQATGTTGGTTNTDILATLPFLHNAIEASSIFPVYCIVNDGGNNLTGQAYLGASDTANVNMRKTDASNWGLGASRVVAVAFEYPI